MEEERLIKKIDKLTDVHQIAQDKYVYYLLSIAASCIAFSLYQTREIKLMLDQIPLGIAIFLWGCSFYFGCKKVVMGISIIYYSVAFLKKSNQIALDDSIAKEQDKNIASYINGGRREAANYQKWQFSLLIWGALFFILWHVLQMWARN